MEVELKDFFGLCASLFACEWHEKYCEYKKATRRRWEENEWGNYGNFPSFILSLLAQGHFCCLEETKNLLNSWKMQKLNFIMKFLQ